VRYRSYKRTSPAAKFARYLLVEITAGGDGSQARLDPCKPITRFKISRFKGNDSGIHSAIIATAAGVVNR